MAKQLNPFQKKIHALEQIQKFKIKTEEDLINLTPAKITTTFPLITSDEIRTICEFQEAVANKTLFMYLCSE